MGLNGRLNFIKQFKATTVFSAFFTGYLVEGFALHLQRQLPAEGGKFFSTQRIPEFVIAGVEMTAFAEAIAQRAENVSLIADGKNGPNR